MLSCLLTNLRMSFFFSVKYFLGYSADEMTGRSWYSLVHPEELSLSADSHRSLSKYTVHCRKNLYCNIVEMARGHENKFKISKTKLFNIFFYNKCLSWSFYS